MAVQIFIMASGILGTENPVQSILTSLNIAGLVLAIFFVTLILTKRDKHIRDYLLAFFIFLLGTFLLIKYVAEYDLFNAYPIIVYLDIYYWVLLGPTLYVYTLVSTKGENFLRLNYLYTLIPAVLVTICFSQYMFGTVTDLFNDWENLPGITVIGVYIWLYNSPIFYILTIIVLRKHQRKIKNHFSFSRSVDLKWLYYLSTGFAIFIFFIMTRPLIHYLFDYEYAFGNYRISLGVVFIYIFGIGYYGYRQGSIFDNYISDHNGEQEPIEQKLTIEPKNHQPYQKSGLNKEDAQIILDNLKTLMLTEQPYLDSELHLAALALKVDVSTHKLSQVINENLNKNFFDFVNEYRIEQVKEFLVDPANNHLKIVSLAYDSGFSSKSTFYNLFKKSEGVTPAEYRLKIQRKVG